MFKKPISYFILLGLLFTFISSIPTTEFNLSESKIDKSITELSEKIDNSGVDNSILYEETNPILEVLSYTNNTPSYVSLFHPEEMVIWLLEDVPFNSTKYHFELTEHVNPETIDVDLYVKFNSIPTIDDYDYVSSSPSNDIESIDIEAPNDHEFGDMYIAAYCVSGSGPIVMRAWYVLDDNGCWRSADLIDTPNYGEAPISWVDTVSSTDVNDFYKIFLHSGQTIKIDVEVTSGWGIDHMDMYLYDENRILFAIDTTGNELDIEYNLTLHKNQFYYLVFRYAEIQNGTHSYSVAFSDENSDPDNRFDGSAVSMIDTGSYIGSLNNSDFNDYFYFYANSGENVTITVSMIDSLDSPYYDAFIYTYNNSSLSRRDVLNSTVGTALVLEYYCAEYNSTEIESGSRNIIFIKIWNAARNAEVMIDTSTYNMTFVRSDYFELDDQLITAPDFLTLGTNDTQLKCGDLSYSYDINDFYKITTVAGYNIKIAVTLNDFSMDYLKGYLYDNNGLLLAKDLDSNVTISFIAPYSGDFYFRVHDYASFSNNTAVCGLNSYNWFIYTCVIDSKNNDFTNARQVHSLDTISNDVNIFDNTDVFKIDIPSGYQLEVMYDFSQQISLRFYSYSLDRIRSDYDLPQLFISLNKACHNEMYYIFVDNTLGHVLATYTMIVTVNQIDPDGDMYSAIHVPIEVVTSHNGTDSLNETDINDFYYFFTSSNGEIRISVEGINGMIVQLVQNISNVVTQLTSITISGGNPVEIVYPSNQSLTSDFKFYLRICNPSGLYGGNYTWNITRIDYSVSDPSNLWVWITTSIFSFIFIVIAVFATVYWIKKKKST